MNDGTVRIELRRRNGPNLWTAIDEIDFDRVARYRWHTLVYPDRIYARTSLRDNGRRSSLYLHRYILGAPDGALVDHINHDGLDNRRSNLRLATAVGNLGNTRLRSDNPSGFKGVAQVQSGAYRARIVIAGKRVWLGTYRTAVEAASAYDDAARAHFGQFACVNFPREAAA